MSDARVMAYLLSQYGRNGDTMLAHITPSEAKLLKKRGGSGTRNPHTGLLEFWGSDSDDNGGPGGGGRGESAAAGEGTASTSGVGDGVAGNNGAGDSAGQNNSYGFSGIGGFRPGMNPEMGGGLARSRGLASVEALGDYGRDVNKSSAVMNGRAIGLMDRFNDWGGWDGPGGVKKGGMAATAVGLGLGLINPALGYAGYHAYNATMRDAPLGKSIGAGLGGMLAGPLGATVGGKLGSLADDAFNGKGMYSHNPAQAGYMGIANSPEQYSGQLSFGGTDGSNSQDYLTKEYGADAGVGHAIAPPMIPEQTLEMAAPARITPESWDEAGFLDRNPEVKAAVSNGTWATGYDFNKAYQAMAGTPYEEAMSGGRPSSYTDQLLAARPGMALQY